MTLSELIKALVTELAERGDTDEVWFSDDSNTIDRVRGVGRFDDGTVQLSYEEIE